jgi:membrane protein
MAKGRWAAALRPCLRDLRTGMLTDRAAALTYYGILSIFPGLLVLVSVLGLVGGPASDVDEVIGTVAPGQAGDFIRNAVNQVSGSSGRAGFAAAVGLVIAFWSASGYLAAFMRAMDAIWGNEGTQSARRSLPLRLGLTAAVGALLVVCVFLVVFTGGLAERTSEEIGLGNAGLTAWNIAKWPVLVLLVAMLLALLYRTAPKRHGRSAGWITPGSITAVLLWIVISALFGVYLATFASYQRTYGALSGVIIFLVWLWLTNITVLFGADFDAQLSRVSDVEKGE